MKKTKQSYIPGVVRKGFFPEVGKNYQMRYRFAIPTILGDEKNLKTIAGKNGLEIYFMTRGTSTPPLIRVLGKVEDFSDLENSEDFIIKMNKVIEKANMRMPRSSCVDIKNIDCSIVSDNDEIFNRYASFNIYEWTRTHHIEGKFVQQDTQDPIANLIKQLVSFHTLESQYTLHKDSRDPDEIMTMSFSMGPSLIRNTVVRRHASDTFVAKSSEILKMTDYKYVINLV